MYTFLSMLREAHLQANDRPIVPQQVKASKDTEYTSNDIIPAEEEPIPKNRIPQQERVERKYISDDNEEYARPPSISRGKKSLNQSADNQASQHKEMLDNEDNNSVMKARKVDLKIKTKIKIPKKYLIH